MNTTSLDNRFVQQVCCVEPLESRIAPAAVAAISLGDLDGANGFKLSGGADSDGAGRSVSSAGDVNGDGFGDLIIGASGLDAGGSDRGAAYVIFGKPGGFAAAFDLASVDGSSGFELRGIADGDSLGASVGSAGDVNGDGFDDLLIAAPSAAEGGENRGAVYVVFGKADAFLPLIDLAELDGSDGFKLCGAADSDRIGASVSGAGDINGDGFAEIIIGAPGADDGGFDRGAAYVVFGKATGFAASMVVSSLDGTNGFKISSAADGNFLGGSARSAGDVNGDGMDDLVIGAAGAGHDQRGSAYVVFGRATGFLCEFNVGTLDGVNGFELAGVTSFDRAGDAVSSAGDINGDGFGDVLVGAFFVNAGGTQRGATYVVLGKASGFEPSVPLSGLNGANGFRLSGVADFDFSGDAVSSVGDVNSDGLDDLIVGANADEGGTDRGAAYIVFGKSGGFAPDVPLSSLDGTNGYKLSGVANGDFAGGSLSAAGDVNGDGFDDIFVGASGANEGGTDRGAAYVIFGSGTADVEVVAKARRAVFTDWDGDIVTITTNKGTLDASQFHLSSPNPLTGGSHLVYADFSAATNGDEFAGARLSITARRGPDGGDGFVNLGTLDARGVSLGRINLEGDLQQLDAAGAAALMVNSMGQFASDDVSGAPLASVIDGTLGTLAVKTNLSRVTLAAGAFGSITAMNLDDVHILASGLAASEPSEAFAIKKLTVFGSITHSQILAGYDAAGAPVNADVQVGPVRVLGQWVASDLVAGVTAGADGIFATSDDGLISNTTSLVAKIASITIRGAAFGTSADRDDGFGFVAEQIGSFSVGSTKLPLQKGPGNDTTPLNVGPTGDVRVREVGI